MEKQFAFKGEADTLYLFIQDVLEELRANLSKSFFEHIRSNCQLVLIEMLTNALKHSGVSDSVIELCVDEQSISIKRVDYGIPLHSSLEVYRVDGKQNDSYPLELVLYQDDLFSLKGIFTSKFELSFEVTEHSFTEAVSPYNLSEHFGLMIITKASKDFRYHHDEKTGKNSYVVKWSR